jgi:hypothetical protein
MASPRAVLNARRRDDEPPGVASHS